MPQAGYFIMANTESMDADLAAGESDPRGRDYAVATWLTKNRGVTAIPPSAFYDPEDTQSRKDIAEKYVRFAFCKTMADLEAAKVKLLERK